MGITRSGDKRSHFHFHLLFLNPLVFSLGTQPLIKGFDSVHYCILQDGPSSSHSISSRMAL